MACFAASGAGTKRVRRPLGSERIKASTFSSRRPGTSQASGAAWTWFRASSGTLTVTPSCGSPGSKR